MDKPKRSQSVHVKGRHTNFDHLLREDLEEKKLIKGQDSDSSSTSNEEYVALKNIQLELELMGFDKDMVEALMMY